MKAILDFFKTHATTIILIILALVIYHYYFGAKCACDGGEALPAGDVQTNADTMLDVQLNANPGAIAGAK